MLTLMTARLPKFTEVAMAAEVYVLTQGDDMYMKRKAPASFSSTQKLGLRQVSLQHKKCVT